MRAVAAADGGILTSRAPEASMTAADTHNLNVDAVAGVASANADTDQLLIQPVVPITPSITARGERHRPSGLEKTTWITLTASQHSAAFFDAWSTRRVLVSGTGYERDPLLRPFTDSAAMYPATQVLPLALDFMSYRMMGSQNRLLHHTWWLPQAAYIAGSVWCGSRNLRVANLRR